MSPVRQQSGYINQAQAAAMVKRRVLELCSKPAPVIRVATGHTNSFVRLFLNAGLEVIETGPFDRQRLLAEGEPYLREFYGSDFDACYPGDTAAKHIRATQEYCEFVEAAGERYRLVPQVPGRAELEAALDQGYLAVVFAPADRINSMPLLVRKLDNGGLGVYPSDEYGDELQTDSVQHLPDVIDLTRGMFNVRRPA